MEEKDYSERPKCSKADCLEHCLVEMRVHTDEGPMHVNVCIGHLLTASQVLESLAQSMIETGSGK